MMSRAGASTSPPTNAAPSDQRPRPIDPLRTSCTVLHDTSCRISEAPALTNPEGFDAAAWMSRWLNDPLPALGGMRPIDHMDTVEGRALVSTTLAKLQSGAYA
jgi:hypothetical protein